MYRFVTALSVLLVALPVLAGGGVGAGSDGDLNCAALFALNPACGDLCDQPCTVQISLALAEPGDWETTPHEEGVGVYDPGEWAIVYQYFTIDIPASVTVTFANHPKGAPVVWLATGAVTIAGQVRLDGADGSSDSNSPRAIPGPGGFSGGSRFLGGSAGFGPGGGSPNANGGGGGGYGAAGAGQGGGPGGGEMYGRDSIVPLIGGSGGSFGSSNSRSGGAGGGAILIATLENITLLGEISANGGNPNASPGGSGSGGGIRLIADEISGSGLLRALGGTTGNIGGVGRIRVEANVFGLDDIGSPEFIMGEPGFVFPEAPAPILRVAFINGIPVPTDPQATVATGDVALTSDGSVQIDIEAENVPVPTTVTVRIVQADGDEVAVEMVELTGTFEMSTATAFFNFAAFDPGKWEVQLTVLLQSP